MKFNKLYIFLALLMTSMSMTACFDDQGADATFSGDYVEFEDGRLPNGVNATLVRASSEQTDLIELQVNRVSTSANDEISVTFEVDPSSTAVSGVHYTLASNSVSVPANEFVATVPVTILTGNIEPSEAPSLKLKMISSTGAEISTNYSEVEINIQVVCPSDISVATDTWMATCVAPGYGTFTATVKVTPLGAGQCVISDVSAGLYAGFGYSTTQEAIYADNCGALSFVARRQAEFGISAPTVDPTVGSFDASTETMVVYWSDPTNEINGTTTLVKQ